MTVSIRLKNNRKVKFQPNAKGCLFSLKCIPDTFKSGKTPLWKDGIPIIDEFDVIRNCSSGRFDNCDITKEYVLEPGCEFLETVNVIVPNGALLMAEIEVFGKDDWSNWIYSVWKVPE